MSKDRRKKTRKITILGMGNEGEYNFMIIKKQGHFFDTMDLWLNEVFPNQFLDISHYPDDNYDSKEEKISDFEDFHESYGSRKEEVRVDVFFGKKKIFLTIYTSLKNRKRLMDKLDDYAVFTKAKKIKELPAFRRKA